MLVCSFAVSRFNEYLIYTTGVHRRAKKILRRDARPDLLMETRYM